VKRFPFFWKAYVLLDVQAGDHASCAFLDGIVFRVCGGGYREALSAFCPTMMRPTSGLSG
jgi:hypothetical protein